MTLTHEQEMALAQKTRGGDKVARDEFITANIPLVVHIAKHYIDRGMELDDLIQEGMCAA
jgi:RNA polymerase primary sigma factor